MEATYDSLGDDGLANHLEGLTTFASQAAERSKMEIHQAALAQEEAIAGIELELERARQLVESDKGVRMGTEEATVSEAKVKQFNKKQTNNNNIIIIIFI